MFDYKPSSFTQKFLGEPPPSYEQVWGRSIMDYKRPPLQLIEKNIEKDEEGNWRNLYRDAPYSFSDYITATEEGYKHRANWLMEQPDEDKYFDIKGMQSGQGGWDPAMVQMAKNLKSKVPQQMVREFETRMREMNKNFMKFPSSETKYEQFKTKFKPY